MGQLRLKNENLITLLIFMISFKINGQNIDSIFKKVETFKKEYNFVTKNDSICKEEIKNTSILIKTKIIYYPTNIIRRVNGFENGIYPNLTYYELLDKKYDIITLPKTNPPTIPNSYNISLYGTCAEIYNYLSILELYGENFFTNILKKSISLEESNSGYQYPKFEFKKTDEISYYFYKNSKFKVDTNYFNHNYKLNEVIVLNVLFDITSNSEIKNLTSDLKRKEFYPDLYADFYEMILKLKVISPALLENKKIDSNFSFTIAYVASDYFKLHPEKEFKPKK